MPLHNIVAYFIIFARIKEKCDKNKLVDFFVYFRHDSDLRRSEFHPRELRKP